MFPAVKMDPAELFTNRDILSILLRFLPSRSRRDVMTVSKKWYQIIRVQLSDLAYYRLPIKVRRVEDYRGRTCGTCDFIVHHPERFLSLLRYRKYSPEELYRYLLSDLVYFLDTRHYTDRNRFSAENISLVTLGYIAVDLEGWVYKPILRSLYERLK